MTRQKGGMMDIVVCVKRVPETAEATLKIADNKKEILDEGLAFGINEADNYALEEALLLKQEFDGEVILLSVGNEAADEVIRMGLAKGADWAVRVDVPDTKQLDPYAVANLLKQGLQEIEHYDLIFTGCIAGDDGYSQVGITLAEMLNIPHISFVVKTEMQKDKGKVQREIESGFLEEYEIKLPAVFTIQTGINEPRYASILGIKRASAKELRVITPEEIIENSGIQEIYTPSVEKAAEIIQGSPNEISEKVAEILKGRGLV